ncbi:hypothetical protein B0J13DRAFT_633247, partial [Dactylonectria estremocensis]
LEKRRDSTIGRLNLSEANVEKLHSRTSNGQLRALQGFAHHGNESITAKPVHPASNRIPPFPTASLPSPCDAPSVNSTGRRQDAMEIFEQYGISRPGGWLSEDGSDILQNSEMPHMKVFRVCHSYGEPLASRKYCPHCGHDSCLKCTSEIPDYDLERTQESIRQHEDNTLQHLMTETLHVGESDQDRRHYTQKTVCTVHRRTPRSGTGIETPKALSRVEVKPADRLELPAKEKTAIRPTALVPQKPIATSVRNNPFLIADRQAKVGATEPKTTVMNVRADRPSRLSDCIPGRDSHSSPSRGLRSQGKRSNANLRETLAGNHPFRHSIGSAGRRSVTKEATEPENCVAVDRGEDFRGEQKRHSPLQSALERKIDQLYHHAENLHHSQHIMEHLAAGSRTLERTAAQQRWADAHENSTLGTGRECPRDHSTDPDDKSMTGFEMAVHSLRRDVKMSGHIPVETHPLEEDLVVERELSPKSHEFSTDVLTRVADSARPHSIYQDSGSESHADHVEALKTSFPVTKRTSPRAVLDKLDETSQQSFSRVQGSRGPSQAQRISARQTDSGEAHQALSPKPITSRQEALSEVPGLAFERPALRKTHKTTEHHDRRDNGALNISSWRQQLRKVDKSEERPRNKQPTPPVVKWRRSLSKLPPTPHSDLDRKNSCTFCHLSEASSSKLAEGAPRLVVDEIAATPEFKQSYAANPRSSRLRLKQVELSLARRSAEDLAEKSNQAEPVVIGTREVRTMKHCKTLSHSSSLEETITEIHDPRPILPPNHACEWRTRCMVLSTEVDQLKSEADGESGRQDYVGSDVGVGANLNEHRCPEIRIEGLTIVMHMRGKDDLVINTSLKNDGFSGDNRR